MLPKLIISKCVIFNKNVMQLIPFESISVDSDLGICKQAELKFFGKFVGCKFKGCLGLFGTHNL